jgi:ribosomal-protein-alanine N-acetyltransferase
MSPLGATIVSILAGAPPPLRLTSPRLVVRPPERRDYTAWAALRGASRAHLEPYEPVWASDALTRQAYARRLARYASEWRLDEGYSFFVFRRDDGVLLGGLGLSNVRRGVAEMANLGYWIGAGHTNQGYMTEAIGLVLTHAFDALGLHRIEAACLPGNGPSRRVLGKLGFREEGFAPEYLMIAGLWQDHVLHAILAPEWRGRGVQA